ncbi:type 1 hydrophobin [Panaeolus papilionaceus]|nr:type 1 hydrophobin [Panaeolus papilionaceus]
MFSKISLVACVAFASLVIAAPYGSDNDINHSCNTGPVQCCNQLVDNNSDGISKLRSFITIPIDITSFGGSQGQIGANCSPQGVLSVLGGSKCDAHTVCCVGNTYNGLINIGCNPISV